MEISPNPTDVAIEVKPLGIELRPGDMVQLGRFASERWRVGFGWFSFGGNRRICGWYVQSEDDATKVKPVQETDLMDIYLVGRSGASSCLR